MAFIVKNEGVKLHLYEKNGFFKIDLGVLSKKMTGVYATSNMLKTNYRLTPTTFLAGCDFLIESDDKKVRGKLFRRGKTDEYDFRET
jgi:hypothetical protein